MVCLEQFSFELFYFLDRNLEGLECLCNFYLIKLTCFGEVDGDAAVHVSACNSVEFFQGHTGLFIGVFSSGARDGEDVG